MMRACLIALSVALLSSCSSSDSGPSVWQRYDALSGKLRAVTQDAGLVSREQRAAIGPMRHGNVVQTKRAAVRLKRCANRLSRQAGHVGNQIRALAARAHSRPQTRYLSLVLTALENQWQEGRRLAAMTDVMWADPLLMSPRDLSVLQREQWAARQAAARAVRAARAALELRRKNRAAFRYVPATPPTRK